MIDDKYFNIPKPGGRSWTSSNVKIELDHMVVLTTLTMASERMLAKVDRHLHRIPGLSHEDLVMLRKAIDDARMVIDG